MRNCRVKRGDPPIKRITKGQYRHALPELKRDFGCRCAYCMRKIDTESEMEVDHFNPRKKNSAHQSYSNLFLADSHCNKAKGKKWPTLKDRHRGLRFLDCCHEIDYGKVIFEEPDTHVLIGTTDAARYHILKIDLNNEGLVEVRRRRSEIQDGINALRSKMPSTAMGINKIINSLEELLKVEIPFIPPPPRGQ